MRELQTKGCVEGAINFLVSRIDEQAQADLVPISRTELNQLSFSEETASESEIAAAAEFDAHNDTEPLETKVAKLLRRAFNNDVKNGNRAVWDMHLAALADKDVYVLVMLDQAGIPRPKPNLVKTVVPKSARQSQLCFDLPLSGHFQSQECSTS